MRRRQQPQADSESLIDIKNDPPIVTSRNFHLNGSSLTTDKSNIKTRNEKLYP